MRIGLVSDIHCDIKAFKMALEHMGPVDRVFCAGDMVLQYRFSNEVVDLIRRQDVLTVMGNHDASILSSAGAMMRANGVIDPANLEFLESLPARVDMQFDGKRLMMMHTSPLDPTGGGRDLRDNRNGSLKSLYESQADVLIVGHTHRAIVANVGDTLVINPGSVGQSRDTDNPDRRTYAVLDTEDWNATIGSFDLPSQH